MQAAWLLALVPAWAFPQPLGLFEVGRTGQHPQNIRHFQHRQDHISEDGEYSLHWEVDTDPDSLLELDLEHTNGAKVRKCGPDNLTVQVPLDVLKRLEKLEHITASNSLHGCKHLEDAHLYHRVLKVRKVTTSESNDTALVEFDTKELETAQQIYRSCRFYVNVMPSSVKTIRQPKRSVRGRRLENFMDFLKDSVNSIGELHGGKLNMKSGFTAENTNEKQGNTFFNLNNPKEKDTFAWNWKYQANSTENPQYKYTFPGGTTWLRLFKPYVNASLGFTMNLSSHMPDITQAPHVIVDVLVRSYADMDLDVGAAANFDKDKSSSILNNVLDTFPIPVLSKLKADTEMFMRPFTFHLGGTPVTITPGMSMNMKIFHIGQLKGTMRVGLKTIVNCTGSMHFDTTFGEQHNFSLEMLNVSFTSPTWMLFTQKFQLGVELDPNFWIKGGMGILRDMEMGFGLRPYLNVSVQEEGLGAGSQTNPLAIYPYRVMGLPTGRCYAIRISANGRYKQTACQMSTGVVEFQNKVQIFEFPPLTEQQLLTEPIKVEILEDGKEPAVSSITIVCKKLVNGMCDPHPTPMTMKLGQQDILVHLGIFFQANALGSLEANMQSVSLRFPLVTFNPQAAKIKQSLSSKEALESMELILYHSGRTYRAKLHPKFPTEVTLFKTNTIWELGPSFSELWISPPVAQTNLSVNEQRLQNLVQIVAGGRVIAKGQLLQTQVTEEKAISNVEDLDSAQQDAMKTLPSQVLLTDPDSPATMVGSCQVELDIMPCEYGAFWVQPFEADKFAAGKVYTFAWATHGAIPTEWYKFNISVVEVQHDGNIESKFMDKVIEVQCSRDSRVKVHRYYGGNLPCVFEHQVEIPQAAVGKSVMAVAGWSDAMDFPHYMGSPPFFVVASERRLEEEVSKEVLKNDESVGFGFESQGHKEGLSPEARAAFKELQSHCSAKPLKYSLGMGINYQQLLKNVPMGAGFGSMGNDGAISGYFTPDGSYITRPYPLWVLGQYNHEKLSNLLPRSVCAGGVCSGMMLGCQKTKVNPIDIPKIAYKFSRTFNWIPHVGPSARHIIAYGLMVLPAAIKEASREAAQMEAEMKRKNESTSAFGTLESLTPESLGKLFQADQRRLGELNIQTPAGGEFKQETLADMEDDWSHRGPFDEMVVQITQPMHFHVTDAVMKYLLSIDAFRGLEDGREKTHGPVKIVGVELLDSPRKAAQKERPRKVKRSTSQLAKERGPVPLREVQSLWAEQKGLSWQPEHVAAAGLVGALCALLAAVALQRRRGYASVPMSSDA